MVWLKNVSEFRFLGEFWVDASGILGWLLIELGYFFRHALPGEWHKCHTVSSWFYSTLQGMQMWGWTHLVLTLAARCLLDPPNLYRRRPTTGIATNLSTSPVIFSAAILTRVHCISLLFISLIDAGSFLNVYNILLCWFKVRKLG